MESQKLQENFEPLALEDLRERCKHVILRAGDAAYVFGCCTRTVHKMCKEKLLEGFQLQGKNARLRVFAVSIYDRLIEDDIQCRLPHLMEKVAEVGEGYAIRMPTEDSAEDLTSGEVAEALGVTTRTACKIIDGKNIPGSYLIGKERRVPRNGFFAYLREKGIEPTQFQVTQHIKAVLEWKQSAKESQATAEPAVAPSPPSEELVH